MKCQDWQLDAGNVESERVQVWSPDTMMGVITKAEAQEMVREGRYFIITGQAIGYIEIDTN